MTKTIIVSGTGGGAGQAVLKCLQNSPYRVVAVDGEPLAAGLYTAGTAYIVPYAKQPNFVSELAKICERENAKLLFPGLDAELPVLAKAKSEFLKRGTQVLVSTPEVVELCDDKLATADFLRANGLPSPFTTPANNKDEWSAHRFPLILKPRKGGARSLGVAVIQNINELDRYSEISDLSQYVLQELVEGDEYTCGTLTLDGRCAGAIVLRRTLRDGDTYKAFVERNSELERFVAVAVEKLQPFGPCNVQLRVRNGTPYIFEFNARFSGTSYCRALAGCNEPIMVANFLTKRLWPEFTIEPTTILRYWKELKIPSDTVRECARTGRVTSKFGEL